MLTPHLDLRAPETEGVWTLAPHLRRELTALLGEGGLLVDPEVMTPWCGDESAVVPVLPAAVALPTTREQVAAILAIADRERLPVTPRGGGTGKVGGAIPLFGGLVVATHGLSALHEIDPRSRRARAGCGVRLASFQAEVASCGLAYPPDPGSAEWATLGGTVATNAAGPSSMKYGTTGDHVLALTVALPGGQLMELGHQSPKGVVGYNLPALVCGSEGTLAIVTDVTLRLRPPTQRELSLLAPFAGVQQAVEGLAEVLRRGLAPRAAELLDAHALAALRREVPGLPPGGAALLLLIDGDEASCEAELLRAADVLAPFVSQDPIVAADSARHTELWKVRALLSKAVKKGHRHYVSEDVGLPPARLGAFVDFLAELRARVGLVVFAYGHAGDGNLHVNVLFDDLAQRPAVDAAVEEIFRQVVALGGTLSGEHGIGAAKRAFLGLEQREELISLQRAIKSRWDPHGIMNPGKIFP